MMIKIVFGIIFESFTELRDIKNNKERDCSYRCFICNIEKDECEKQNEDFYEHCNRIHNVWDYACYIIMLKMADFQDLNGINAICKEMILEKQPKWVPDKEQNGDNE
jgi:inositol 1,4,5-triphosphate receptor type 1